MKKFLLFLFTFSFPLTACFAQETQYAKVETKTIFVKADSIEQEIKNGSLAFLNNCEWEEIALVNGIVITQKRTGASSLKSRRKGHKIDLQKIKKKNPDGSFTILAPVKIIIE